MGLLRARWLAALLVIGILVALGLAVYGQVLDFQFVTGDDRLLIVNNPLVTAWSHAPLRERLLTPAYGYAIPVTVASFALDWRLFHGDPAGFHLVNLLLHLATTLLLFRCLCRLTPLPAALCGALLFLLHPVQAETVAFVTQRKDLLVVLFALLALRAALAAEQERGRAGVMVAAAALAGLAKPSGVLIAPLLAVLLLLPGGAVRGSRRLAAALLLTGGALITVNLYVDAHAALALDRTPLALPLRIGLLGSTLVHYLQVLIWPVGLLPKVPRPVAPAWGAVAVFAAGAAAMGLGLGLAVRRRAARAQLLLCWLMATYLPIANLAPLSRHAADCYLYAPLCALALGLALLAERLWRRPPLRALLAVGMVALGGAWGLRCHQQVAVWRDEQTLFAYLYRMLPANKESMREYSDLLLRSGQQEQALAIQIEFYEQALRQSPESLPARHWLLRLHLQRGGAGELAAARRLIDEVPAAQRDRPGYHELRLEFAMSTRDYAAALAAVEALVRQRPDHPRRALLPELRQRLQRKE